MEKFLVPLETPCVYHDPCFLNPLEADEYYQILLKSIPWEKTSKINRWVYLCQEIIFPNSANRESSSDGTEVVHSQQSYSYKDAPRGACEGKDSSYTDPPFPETVQKLRKACQDWYHNQRRADIDNHGSAPPSFNVCLLNFYQDGTQRIGWHSDREEIGRTTPIASVSLGTTRQFLIRSQANGVHDRVNIHLQHGSLLVMEPVCQVKYLHSIAKEPDILDGRINLTFRCKNVGETTAGEEMHGERDHALDNITEGVDAQTYPWTVDNFENPTTPIFGVYPLTDDDGTRETLLPSQLYFLAKTNLGAERYTAAEILEQLQSQTNGYTQLPWKVIVRPMELDGFVGCFLSNGETSATVDSLLESMPALLLKLQSVYHVVKYHCHFRLGQCIRPVIDDSVTEEMMVPKEALYEYVKGLLLDGKLSFTRDNHSSTTFRVTCERIGGPHAWQAPDVEYEIGGAISQVMEPKGWKVMMNDYDLCIRADVIGRYIVISTQLNVQDMTKGRYVMRYRNAVTIKTNLAYAMIRLANIREGDTLLDPFCGSGTILLEALQMFNGKISVVGMDVSKKSADGARTNAGANGYDSTCKSYLRRFVTSDARGLRRHVDEFTVDAVVTNLPWGIMTGRHQSIAELQTLYEVFLRTCWYALKDRGRIVLFVLRGLQMSRIIRKLSGRYRLLHVNVIRTTNNLPCIIVIEKLEADVVRDSIKGQLAHLNQFVNVSPEIFQSIHTEELEE